jgi:hypothetical protein
LINEYRISGCFYRYDKEVLPDSARSKETSEEEDDEPESFWPITDFRFTSGDSKALNENCDEVVANDACEVSPVINLFLCFEGLRPVKYIFMIKLDLCPASIAKIYKKECSMLHSLLH